MRKAQRIDLVQDLQTRVGELAKQLGASKTLRKPFRLKALVEAGARALEDGNEPQDRTSEEWKQQVDFEENDQDSKGLLSLTLTSL